MSFIALLATLAAPSALGPYPLLHGGARTGVKVAASPDPLVDYKWDMSSIDKFAYQVFVDHPVEAVAEPASAFSGVSDMMSAGSVVGVHSAGLITIKFAQEGACWVEFESKGLAASGAKMDMTISENRLPGEVHNLQPTARNGTYRLEPNNQLYEGVRYIFVNVTAPGSAPWAIENFRRVCQTVPTNYEGHFSSSDETLNKIWWTGAYTARVTMVGVGLHSPQAFLGSELKDRGDRIAFLGDAHATQPTVLAAFKNYEMLWSSNEHTKGTIGSFGGIQPYWLMWCSSILDLYDATGNVSAFKSYQPYIEQRFDHAESILSSWIDPENAGGFNNPSLDWSRDDDRMGFGFESPNLPEARNAFKALLVGTARRYSAAIGKLGNQTAGKTYAALAAKVEKDIKTTDGGGGRSADPWYKDWGMHASSDAVIAGIVSPAEGKAMLADDGVFGDPLQLPSLSNFESFFILKALGALKASVQAGYLVHRHWAGMLRLGATTFWERFDPQWEDAGCLVHDDPPANAMNQDTSMSHPWATGATSFLSKFGLGVEPVDPGFVSWQAVPILLDNVTLSWVRGAVPTPHSGPIAVDFDLRTGIFEVSAPDGAASGRLGIPKLGQGVAVVTVMSAPLTNNGAVSSSVGAVWKNHSSSADDPSHAQQQQQGRQAQLGSGGLQVQENDELFMYITGLCPGTHRFMVRHVQPPPRPQQQREEQQTEGVVAITSAKGKWDPNNTNFAFAATLHGIDHTTGGSWVGKYGSAGYVLFNYSESGKDIVKTDSRIKNVFAISGYPSAGGPPYPVTTPPRPACNGPRDAVNGGSGTSTGGPLQNTGGAGYTCTIKWANASTSEAVLEPPSPHLGSGIDATAATAVRTAAAISGNRWASFHIDIEAADQVRSSIETSVQ
eukprot:COSAG02_NODE_5754_length_4063_cov_16.384208_2_plen_896_part_00